MKRKDKDELDKEKVSDIEIEEIEIDNEPEEVVEKSTKSVSINTLNVQVSLASDSSDDTLEDIKNMAVSIMEKFDKKKGE